MTADLFNPVVASADVAPAFPATPHPTWGPLVKLIDVSADLTAAAAAAKRLGVPVVVWAPLGHDGVRRRYVKAADAAAVRSEVLAPAGKGAGR